MTLLLPRNPCVICDVSQVSVLITPLLVHLSGEHVRGVEWLACGLGLLGSALVAADSLIQGGPSQEGVMNGDGTVGNEVRPFFPPFPFALIIGCCCC